MDRREELQQAEAKGWEELAGLLSRLDPPQMVQPGLTEEWTVNDLLAHLAAWLREATDDLERIGRGHVLGVGVVGRPDGRRQQGHLPGLPRGRP